jgi:hypothetical protein
MTTQPIIYKVDYRSSFGSLNTETIQARDEADIRNVFEGIQIVSIEAVETVTANPTRHNVSGMILR